MSVTVYPRVQALVAAFEHVYRERMQGLPIVREDFKVQAVGFSAWQGRLLGVLITPWFMNLILLPGDEDEWSRQKTGSKAIWHLPAGDFEFTAAVAEQLGPYQSCALFSSLAEFPDQTSARRVAQAIVDQVLDGSEQSSLSQLAALNQRPAVENASGLSRRDLLRGRLRGR
jgi:[NiFe] hydrogenase assembly HybE family chaperone